MKELHGHDDYGLLVGVPVLRHLPTKLLLAGAACQVPLVEATRGSTHLAVVYSDFLLVTQVIRTKLVFKVLVRNQEG